MHSNDPVAIDGLVRREARRKLVRFIALTFLILGLAYYLRTNGSEEAEKTLLTIGVIVLVGLGIFDRFTDRQLAKEVKCPRCFRALFSFIHLAREMKEDFRFCPFCGEPMTVHEGQQGNAAHG